jgi:ribonuclease HI
MIIYTDGSAHPNPGPGGYGIIVVDDKDNLIDCYSFQTNKTTNNEMEMSAILDAFLHYGIIPNEDDFFQELPMILSDSHYAVETFNNWMFTWERKGWIKSDKKVPENLEIVKKYFNHWKKGYRIDLKQIRGHKGIKGNEFADKLATGKLTTQEVYTIYDK